MIGWMLCSDVGQAGQVHCVTSAWNIPAAFTVAALNRGSVTVVKDGAEFTAITVRNYLGS